MSQSEKWFRQFALVCGQAHVRCWLEDDNRLVVGASVTLPKADIGPKDALWTIMERGEFRTQERAVNKKWNVGGVYVEQRRPAPPRTP